MEERYLGEVSLCGFNFSPRNFAYCDGQLVMINDNAALFSLLSNHYGGDGRSVFGLPDLRGRSAIGYGKSNELVGTYGLGQKGGVESYKLAPSNLPKHTHPIQLSVTGDSEFSVGVQIMATKSLGDTAVPTEGAYIAQSTDEPGPDAPPRLFYTQQNPPEKDTLVALGGVTVTNAVSKGGQVKGDSGTNESEGSSIPTLGPYQALSYIICTQGLYPSRN
jgi:microcystin-dependent protein